MSFNPNISTFLVLAARFFVCPAAGVGSRGGGRGGERVVTAGGHPSVLPQVQRVQACQGAPLLHLQALRGQGMHIPIKQVEYEYCSCCIYVLMPSVSTGIFLAYLARVLFFCFSSLRMRFAAVTEMGGRGVWRASACFLCGTAVMTLAHVFCCHELCSGPHSVFYVFCSWFIGGTIRLSPFEVCARTW